MTQRHCYTDSHSKQEHLCPLQAAWPQTLNCPELWGGSDHLIARAQRRPNLNTGQKIHWKQLKISWSDRREHLKGLLTTLPLLRMSLQADPCFQAWFRQVIHWFQGCSKPCATTSHPGYLPFPLSPSPGSFILVPHCRLSDTAWVAGSQLRQPNPDTTYPVLSSTFCLEQAQQWFAHPPWCATWSKFLSGRGDIPFPNGVIFTPDASYRSWW